MIDYNFGTLIFNPPQLDSCAFYQAVSKKINFVGGNVIDSLWERIKTVSKDSFIGIASSILDSIKTDVLFSLYTSVCYTINPGIPRSEIIPLLQSLDPALKNEDSAKSERENLSHKKSSLRKDFQPKNIEVLLAGQYFDNNTLLYFQPFWDISSGPIRCFDVADYIRYIKNSHYWPYDNQNCNGMSFNDYFNGIRNMAPNCFDNEKMGSLLPFDAEFSIYIFEQLFSPVSFIDNLLLHQQNFADLFDKLSNSSREQSIILLQPLFKLPHSLWECLSDSYVKSLRNYINEPNNIELTNTLCDNMKLTLFYKQFIYPLIKITVGNFLYYTYAGNLTFIKELLYDYLSSHTDFLNYQSTFINRMDALAITTYPNKKAIDSVGAYLHEMQIYQKLNQEAKTKHPQPKEPRGNDAKRNNKSIKSYEINFTYQFFRHPPMPDFFNYMQSRRQYNLDPYLENQVRTYLQESLQTPSGCSTLNYCQKECSDLGISPFNIIN